MNEMPQLPVVKRFIETLTALMMQYEQDIEPALEDAPPHRPYPTAGSRGCGPGCCCSRHCRATGGIEARPREW